jgi:aromatic ring-opening dioxygenase catalytic subunit (LigB family)
MATHLSKLVASTCPEKPQAVLVVSAHWETRNGPTVNTCAAPPLLFDYHGFPPETYELTWPAPGDPALASRVKTLLDNADFRTSEDATRGFDHGVFCPLKLAFPDADVPVVQLSLVEGLDPETHLAMGRALAPLRREGVLIIGSGMSYHNMGGFMGGDEAPKEASKEFDAWLAETCSRCGAFVRESRTPCC